MLYPLLFKPIIKKLIWGQEHWVISAVSGSESIVSNGIDAGLSLPQMVKKYGGELLGNKVFNDKRYNHQFPLLVKFIKSEKDLSVQVHPNDEIALHKHNCFGKNEMWYVLDAKPGAKILSGLKNNATRQDIINAIANNSIVDLLNMCDALKGDVFYLPAGRIHSIGGGCNILEIQQSSDITYRLYDYNRLGADGKPRQLHIDLALDAINYQAVTNPKEHFGTNENDQLLTCPFFDVTKHNISHNSSFTFCNDNYNFAILIVINGNGTIKYLNEEKYENIHIENKDSVLLPAIVSKITISGNLSVVICKV